MTQDLRDLLPLPPHDFQVLLALLDMPRHAYGLARAVDQENGDVRLEIGCFRPEGLVSARLSRPVAAYREPASVETFYASLLARL